MLTRIYQRKQSTSASTFLCLLLKGWQRDTRANTELPRGRPLKSLNWIPCIAPCFYQPTTLDLIIKPKLQATFIARSHSKIIMLLFFSFSSLKIQIISWKFGLIYQNNLSNDERLVVFYYYFCFFVIFFQNFLLHSRNIFKKTHYHRKSV